MTIYSRNLLEKCTHIGIRNHAKETVKNDQLVFAVMIGERQGDSSATAAAHAIHVGAEATSEFT